VGIAPLVIGIFSLASIQPVFLGILDEYVGAIHTQVQHRPLAVELERVNFEYEPGLPEHAEPRASGSRVLEAAHGDDHRQLRASA